MSKKPTDIGVGKKVLASALSAAMVVAFAPAVGTAVGSDDNVAYAEENATPAQSDTVAMIGSTEYNSLQDAVNNANGSEVTLVKDVDLGSESLNINSAVTLSGGEEKHSITSSATNVINVITNGVSLEGSVVLKDLSINAQCAGNGQSGVGYRAGCGVCIGYSNTVAVDKLDLQLAGCDITATGRGVTVAASGCNNVNLTVSGTTMSFSGIDNFDTNVDNRATRGISLWNMNRSTVVVENSIIQGFSYSINDAGSGTATDTKVQMRNSAFKGRAAINSSRGGIAWTVTDCDVLGINNQSGESEDFACIVFDKDINKNSFSSDNNTIEIDNTKFSTFFDSTGLNNKNATESLFRVRGDNNILSIDKNKAGTSYSVCSPDKGSVSGTDFNLVTPSGCSLTIYGGVYSNIADAMKYAADNATLKMGADATASLTIPAGKNITLDLNGKTLTNAAGKDTIVVEQGATLKVDGQGTVDNVSNAATPVYNNGTVVLNGGSYTRSMETGDSPSNGQTKNTFYNILNHGTMTINSDVNVVQSGNYSSLIDNGYFAYKSGNARSGHVAGTNAEKPQLTINGGTFSGGINTIKNDDNGQLIVEDGSFTNYTQAALQNHGTAKVSGGTFNAELVFSIDNCGCDKTLDPGKLEITDGMFKGALKIRSSYSDVNISGGTFVGGIVKAAGKLAITGGTFSVDPAAYLADGSVVYKKHSGTDGYSYIAQASGAARPANSSGYNYWTSADGKTYTEGYSAPVTPTPAPDPEPTPTPEPAAPGTNVSGTDSAGNTVEATVTSNEKTTLPDGTEAAGSVEYKGTASSGSEPASSAEIPSSVTSSDGTVYAVTKIADDAFNGQGQLKSVSIPATVVEIGARAFAGTGIESVELPAATSTLGAGAFQGCASLKTADISSAALTQIPADAFNGAAITSIDIPGTVKSVGARAFKGTALRSVELPKAVASIAKSTFQDCDALKSASSSAKTIGRSAFAGCGSLKTVSLPKATEVGAYALSGTALKSVSLPKAESIGAGAFKDAAKLKALATGSVLEELGPKALSGTKVKTLTIKSKRLTKPGVKGSLKGSAVTKVEVAVTGSKKTQDKYVKRYSKFFAKANSGKSVEVTKAKKASKK